MTPADSRRIYALIETGDGVPWNGIRRPRAASSGAPTTAARPGRLVNYNRDLGGPQRLLLRGARVATDDADEVYFLTAAYSRSLDGGAHVETADRRRGPSPRRAGDHHDMWIDPTNADRMIVAHDGGVSISENRGKTWLTVQLPIAQMYHVTVDNADSLQRLWATGRTGPRPEARATAGPVRLRGDGHPPRHVARGRRR